MKATDLYFNLVQKQKFLQSVSASERKNPKKLTQSTNFYKSTIKGRSDIAYHTYMTFYQALHLAIKETSTLL